MRGVDGTLDLATKRNARSCWPVDDDGVPTTRLARVVSEFVAAHCPQFLVDHCRRSYRLAVLTAAAEELAVDFEVLFAAVMMHDLGLTPRFHARHVRFEVAGADAAREFVIANGMSSRRAEWVWDAIALHGVSDVARAKSPETRVACAGIGADVTGAGLDGLDSRTVAKIMTTRAGFARPFIDAVVADLRDKPDVANSTWMAPIAAAHIPGFRIASVEEAAYANPYES